MNDGMPWATQYASFIFLGVSVLFGYLIWRVRSSRRSHEQKRTVAEEMLAQEIAQLEKRRGGAQPDEHDGSGLGAPSYTAEERALLDRARAQSDQGETGP